MRLGGATIAQRLKPVFDGIPLLKAYSEGISVTIVVTIITYLSLVMGELGPKRIALNNPEQIACIIARPMRFLARLTALLVHILDVSTDILINLLGVRTSNEPDITEEEIKVLIRQGAEAGMFEEAEHEMVERVFRLGDRPIKAIMTPRTEIDWLDIEGSLEQNLETVMSSNHARFPVGRGSLDNCVGVIRGSNLLRAQLSGQSVNLEALLQSSLYLAESDRALTVIEQFKQTGIHIALVTDEYGGIEGLVTLNNLMEAIVGDLPSTENQEEPLIIQREDGSWLLDGSLDLYELKALIDRDRLPNEETNGFYTIGGFVHVLLRTYPSI